MYMNANIMKTQIEPKLKHELKGHERSYKAKFFLTLNSWGFLIPPSQMHEV